MRRVRWFPFAGLLLASAFVLPSGAVAQGPAFGVLGGVNFAQIVVDDDEEGSETSGRRTSWVLGLYADLKPLSSFSFRPELLVAEKGGEEEDDAEGGTVGVKLRYVQIPVLGRFSFGTGAVRPFIVAGPSIAFRIDCELEFVDEDLSISVPCDESEDVDEGESDPIETFDVSGIIGGGIDFGAFALSARYDHGFSDLAKVETSTVNTRTFTILASFRIGGR